MTLNMVIRLNKIAGRIAKRAELAAAAVVMAVAFLPGVHDLMGFAAPGWSTAFVPPLCVLLTIAWLRWPAAAMAIRRRWRPGVGAHSRVRTTDP